ncbi:hypothetical protein [Marinactinospora rubrisoli]|uniref:Uncharacterized protein n=1 Tax=Marinactinospora rubrisoli TaxID=2715399 RepID=A0ABW2KET2_9ACTN
MNVITGLNWRLVLGLGALALIRPLVRIVEDQAGITGQPVVPIVLTIAISAVWIAAAGFTEVRSPVLTLLGAALTYGVLSIVLSGVLSPILTGELQGPLAQPIGIVGILAVNAVWGLAAGAVALAIRRLRAARSR